MSWFRKVRERREADRLAEAKSKAMTAELIATEPELEERHFAALRGLKQATEQAKKLRATDTQNHYSESLTHAFRGNPAS